MPHVKLAVSQEHKDKSAGGIYGDVVEEMDANLGRLLQALKDEGLDDNTYVIFTSDNGPWYFGRSPGHRKRFGQNWAEHGGSAAPFRGAKTSTWEGGLRVPFIIRAPGKVPAGSTCAELATTMDILPTFAELAGAQAPTDRVIDGHDVSTILHGKPDGSDPDRALYYYRRTRLEAVRLGTWKLRLPTPVDKMWGHYSKAEDDLPNAKPLLFDLAKDPAETTDISEQHPETVAQLLKKAEHARQDIGDYDRIGANARFFDSEPKRNDIKN